MFPKSIAFWSVLAVTLAATQDPLPTADQILERHVAVTGGRAAYEQLKSELRVVSMELKGRDVRFTATVYRARPNRMYTVTEIPGLGKIEEGVDGEVAWSVSANRGAVLKQGAERDFALYGARLDTEANWKDWFPKAEMAATEEFEGRTCYKLLLTDKEGDQHSRWYDKETGFLVRVVLLVKLPQGQFPADMRFYDYRKAGDLLVAHRTVRVMPGQETESRIEKIEPNIEVDPERFALPDAIKALVDKREPR
jgi:outer membrane lipoprotein-sorting protein